MAYVKANTHISLFLFLLSNKTGVRKPTKNRNARRKRNGHPQWTNPISLSATSKTIHAVNSWPYTQLRISVVKQLYEFRPKKTKAECKTKKKNEECLSIWIEGRKGKEGSFFFNFDFSLVSEDTHERHNCLENRGRWNHKKKERQVASPSVAATPTSLSFTLPPSLSFNFVYPNLSSYLYAYNASLSLSARFIRWTTASSLVSGGRLKRGGINRNRHIRNKAAYWKPWLGTIRTVQSYRRGTV